ncbi:SET domain-containing protein [Pseudovirgaria hyperparasitica]|uniref:SET domain-containing protein n=1 Tax=Pseudovirgaria hyperparasitica TaxID=470096 RepID=A0A6A6VZB6_9PEZI|nr:SET domain-containing protein [Pseudovirgaria hyperparasitica]KAF2755219.1 SET domain-containing protein [Pseudovirgaria hyperparasitica]
MDPPPGAPTSPYFAVAKSESAGRGVFATCDIPAGTHVFTANDLTAHVIQREYRREVCALCFAYDRGKNLKQRDALRGFAFCTPACEQAWKSQDGVTLRAWAAVERLVRARSREDAELVDADAARPGGAEIKAAWHGVRNQALLVREARTGMSTKMHRKAVQQAISNPVSADTLPLQLSAVLHRYRSSAVWSAVLALASNARPYNSTEELRSHVNSYLHLLAVLPEELLEVTTAETVLTVLTRDSHNSFGIRSLEDDGAEFFGYGVWPSASYFNHSCAPNVLKQRVGSTWVFTTERDVEAGSELCITYLSGEERALSRNGRMTRLKKAWGFECACERCADI